MYEQSENFNKMTENIKQNQTEIIELKNTNKIIEKFTKRIPQQSKSSRKKDQWTRRQATGNSWVKGENKQQQTQGVKKT